MFLMAGEKLSFIGKGGRQAYQVVPDEVVVRLRDGACAEDLPAKVQPRLLGRIKNDLLRLRLDLDEARGLLADCVDAVFPVLREETSGLRLAATDELTVRFRPDLPEGTRDRLLGQAGLEVVRRNRFVPEQFAVRLKNAGSTYTVFKVAEWLNGMNEVTFATPDFLAEIEKSPFA